MRQTEYYQLNFEIEIETNDRQVYRDTQTNKDREGDRHMYTVRLTDGMTSAYVSREKYISYSKVI